MAILVHRYDAPDRFVAGTVGQPGERTFFLQAREGNRITSVACREAAGLGAGRAPRPGPRRGAPAQRSGGATCPRRSDEAQRHRSAGRADHRGVPGRHHDDRLGPEIDRIVIELSPTSTTRTRPRRATSSTCRRPRRRLEAADEVDADEVFVVKITAAYARDFVARAQALVSAGRPPCPFCLQPLDPAGHVCPRANGYRRPLFG